MQIILGMKRPDKGMLICVICDKEFKRNSGRVTKYCPEHSPRTRARFDKHGEILRCFLSMPGNAIVCNNSGTFNVYTGKDTYQMDTFDEVMIILKAKVD